MSLLLYFQQIVNLIYQLPSFLGFPSLRRLAGDISYRFLSLQIVKNTKDQRVNQLRRLMT